jgi:hypothetical protein
MQLAMVLVLCLWQGHHVSAPVRGTHATRMTSLPLWFKKNAKPSLRKPVLCIALLTFEAHHLLMLMTAIQNPCRGPGGIVALLG